ncbi:synaptotagmin-4 [Syngnathus scovelli]|uniref:synaptotagmin-4 n=1 Tax=Syngnathus scovelli TaxID=161590 RepID=UPI00210FC4BB|nr:synaptotagmin-4 [Syngnathus scovelli]
MAPVTLEDGAQPVAVPGGVAAASVFGLIFTASAFAWICCQRKNTKGQKTPPYKFVHMLKGVDIYPESLGGKKKFAPATGVTTNKVGQTDVNGNCRSAVTPVDSPELASSPGGSRSALHLDLEQLDLNGNFPTKPSHQLKVRRSPDLEPGTTDRREPPSPSISSHAPTPATDEREGRLGTLRFALEYHAEKKAFIVHIQEARDLSPTDEQSLTSDPYIKLTLLPEKKHRVKTRVLRKTLDPTFDETFSFYGIPLPSVSKLALQFMVLSFDRFSRDEIIGETLVPLSGIDLSEGRVLMSREIIKRNVKKSWGRGELLLSLCYQSATNTLTVVVLKARHLPKNDNNGPSDPYVKVNLYHGKKRVCKKKTRVKKCAPNPVFNEPFTFDLPSDHGPRDAGVELLLMDSDPGDSRCPKPVLGRLLMGMTAAGTAGEHWREICEHPRRQIAKWHAMSEG